MSELDDRITTEHLDELRSVTQAILDDPELPGLLEQLRQTESDDEKDAIYSIIERRPPWIAWAAKRDEIKARYLS